MKKGHRLRANRPLLSAVGVVLLVVAACWWMLAGGAAGTSFAVVVTCAAALLTLLVAVFGVPWHTAALDHASLAVAARDLARDVGEAEAAQQQRLLADTGQAEPADIGFRQPELVHWRGDKGAEQGSLKDIKAFYEGLGHGRLVILGKAGAGKTVLVGKLLIDLITALPGDNPPPGTTLTVPVRLSLSSFNPGGNPDWTQSAEMSNRLDAWVSNYLITVYGVKNSQIARALVHNGWVLPILDGLDEMDSTNEKPLRAAAIIRALNHPTGTRPRRVVLTCRTDRYRELTNTGAPAGQQPVLQDATAVRILPLTPDQIKSYLTYRFPDPAHPGHIESRWRPVVRSINGPPPTALATALSSPLRLFLAITAYYDPASDPTQLTQRPHEVERDLMVQLIPATVSQHPKPDGTLYDSGHVTDWLTTFADYLHVCQERRGGSGSDIDLEDLWMAAGKRILRLSVAIQSLITALPLLALGGLGLINSSSHWSLIGSAAIFAGGVCIVALTFIGATYKPVRLIRTDLSWLRSSAGRRTFMRKLAFPIAGGLAFGSLGGLALWIQFHRLNGLGFGITSGLAIGIALGLIRGIERRPTAIKRPSQLVSQGLIHDVSILLLSGLVGGLAVAIVAWFSFRFGYKFVSASIGGFILGFGLGMSRLYDSPWPRYLTATYVLARVGWLPPRLSQFLNWGYTAGLLRLSGTSIQFRHRELQDHLASGQTTSQGRARGSATEAPVASQ